MPDPAPSEPDWESLRPVLDEAMHDLGEAEREAVLLRYFEQRSWAEVGARLGLTENTARMRVERALDKLHAALAKRDITSTAAALGLALGAHAVAAAPAGLAARLAAAALAAGGGTVFGVSVAGKLALATLVLLLGLGALVWTAQRAGWTRAGGDPAQAAAATAGAAAESEVAGTGASTMSVGDLETGGSVSTAARAAAGADEPEIRLTFMDRETGQPVPGVRVECIWIGAPVPQRHFTASREGEVTVRLVPGITALQFTSVSEGHADTRLWWRTERGDVIPESHTVRLERAVLIGGTVVDPDGRPVAGAQVGWNHLDDPSETAQVESHEFGWIEVPTGADGRWQIDRIAGSMLERLHGGATHPEFRPAEHVGHPGLPGRAELVQQLRDQMHVFRLRAGGVLAGVVVSQLGEPLAGAKVLAGQLGFTESRETKTAEDGTFELRGVPLGKVPVTAEAEGYAAKTEVMELAETNPPVRLELWLGTPLRLRVVNRAGEPVPRAFVWLNTFDQELRPEPAPNTLVQASFDARTDAEGRAVWTDAPLGLHRFDIEARGYMRTNQVAIPADGHEHMVTLAPALVIQGRVTDAATGEPVPQFRLALGYLSQDTFNNRTNARFSSIDRFNLAFTGGTYRHSIEEEVSMGGDDSHCVVKFEAEGYRAQVSRPLRYDEGVVTLDMALEPAKGIEVTVLDPAGQPAGGAEAGLIFPGANLTLGANGSLALGGSEAPGALRRADHEGRLRLQDDPQVARVVIAHPEGHLETTLAALAADPVARLRPWGRIEGKFLGAAGTLAGRQVAVSPRDWMRGELAYEIAATSDAEGRFVLPRVPPGRVAVKHVIVNHHPDGSSSGYARQRVWAGVASGETARVTFGGHRVTGRLRVPEGFTVPPGARWYAGLGTPVPEPPLEIRGNAAVIQQWSQLPEVREARYHTAHLALDLQPDGSFIAEDVGAGEHLFVASLMPASSAADGAAPAGPLLRVRVIVSVPAGAAGSVVDLGEVVAEVPVAP